MPSSVIPRLGALFVLSFTVSADAVAQGALGSQGFGYPTGQMSAGALGSGGAGAESDPNSGLNPAAIAQPNRFSLMLQFEPEYRSTRVGGQSERASIVRFPAFTATGAFKRFVGSVGVTSMLDRTWSNNYADSLLIDGNWTPASVTAQSEGSLSDVRAAASYIASRRLQIGVGLHGLTGENRTGLTYTFPDSTGVGFINQSASFGFKGSALSLGIVSEPKDGLQFSASVRSGGEIVLEQGGAEVGAAKVPLRVGVGVTWAAIPGAALSARVDQTRWSDLEGLGSAQLSLFDATEFAGGLDVLGPKVGSVNTALRVGLRDRTLPFGLDGDAVKERIWAFGAGVPVSRGRAQIDLALQRATRTSPGVSEQAWLISVGLGIRP